MALSFEAAGRVLQHVGRLLLLRADLAAEELALVFAVAGLLLLRGLVQAAERTPAALSRTRAALHEDYEGLAGAIAPQREPDRHE